MLRLLHDCSALPISVLTPAAARRSATRCGSSGSRCARTSSSYPAGAPLRVVRTRDVNQFVKAARGGNRRRHDLDASEATKHEEIGVSGDDRLRPRLHRTFENSVVVCVVRHDVQRVLSLDVHRESENLIHRLGDGFRIPIELRVKDARSLGDDRIGDRVLYIARPLRVRGLRVACRRSSGPR